MFPYAHCVNVVQVYFRVFMKNRKNMLEKEILKFDK